jgi:hypothetical protein
MLLPSDRAERDRFVKHLKQKPPPERPPDYGHQSPRLMGEILDGMANDYAEGEADRRQHTADLFNATPTERKHDG